MAQCHEHLGGSHCAAADHVESGKRCAQRAEQRMFDRRPLCIDSYQTMPRQPCERRYSPERRTLSQFQLNHGQVGSGGSARETLRGKENPVPGAMEPAPALVAKQPGSRLS